MPDHEDHLKEMVRHMILADPERWPHWDAALNTIYCESGNGLVWPEGEGLRPREGTLEDLFGPPCHGVPDIEHRLKEFYERCRKGREDFAAAFKDEDKPRGAFHAEYTAYRHAQTGYSKPAPDSLFLNVPDRSQMCWFDGLQYVAGEIFDKYPEVYKQYEDLDRAARKRRHYERLKGETDRFAEDGVLTSWLHLQSALQMQGYGFLRRKDPHNLERPGWLAREVHDAFFAQEACEDFAAFVDQRRAADPLLPVFEAFEEINQVAKRFEREIWLSLKAYYNASDLRGHSATVNGVRLLMWGSAGRVLVTLGREGKRTPSVTLIGSDGIQDSMGVQGISATKEETLSLFHGVFELGGRVVDHFSPDNEVSVG